MFTLLKWTLLRLARRRMPELFDGAIALAELLEYFEELKRDYPELFDPEYEPELVIAA